MTDLDQQNAAQAAEDSGSAAQVEVEGQQGSELQEDSSQQGTEGGEGQQPKKSKGGFQQRIDQLTREKYEALRKAQEYEARLQQLEQQLQQVMPQQEPLVDDLELPPMPTIDQFDYDDAAYQAAMKQWADLRAAKAQEKIQQQLQQQQQMEALRQQQIQLMRKVEEAQSKYPDFVQRINDPSLPNLQQVNPAAYEAVVNSDAFADVAYYIASNPAEAYELATLSPVEAVKKVAFIEAKFKGQKNAGNNAAPPPQPPQTTKGAAETSPDMEKLSIDEWMERRWQQLEKR